MRAPSIRQRYCAGSFAAWPTIEIAQTILDNVEVAKLET